MIDIEDVRTTTVLFMAAPALSALDAERDQVLRAIAHRIADGDNDGLVELDELDELAIVHGDDDLSSSLVQWYIVNEYDLPMRIESTGARFALNGKTYSLWKDDREVMTIRPRSFVQTESHPWIREEAMHAVARRSVEDAERARDIAMVADAAARGCTLCVYADARWETAKVGTQSRMLAKHMGMHVVRMVFDRAADGSMTFKEA